MNELLKKIIETREPRSIVVANVETKKKALWFPVSYEEAIVIARHFGYENIKAPSQVDRYICKCLGLDGEILFYSNGLQDVVVFK